MNCKNSFHPFTHSHECFYRYRFFFWGCFFSKSTISFHCRKVSSMGMPAKLAVVYAFLLSFSQPNFYFHATTAYGILRMKGLKIGKIDYLGAMRISA